uniref:SUEL-type lectin domain-containing protein n=1 Tax=Myripristis murdjan TaxID=586833 RepID=A0A667ZDZ3_9TELE
LQICCILVYPERVTSCGEHTVHRLSCDVTVISVVSSFYGRADRVTCSAGRPAAQLANTGCSLPGTLEIVKTRCNGKRVCELNANTLRASDPCNGTYKYMDTTFICLPAIHVITCEHSATHLHCGPGQIIAIHNAVYGRRDQTTCSYKHHHQNVYCSRPTNKVAESCNGKNSCTIYASNSVFGDPCRRVYKYLELAYTCECKSCVTKLHQSVYESVH